MPYLLVRHKVEDYAKWKPVYDEHAGVRKANGSKGAHLFRNADDPDEIVILLEWDDMKKVRQFSQSDELRETMQKAGVIGMPDLYFLDEVEQTEM